jgi:hypothetical protein
MTATTPSPTPAVEPEQQQSLHFYLNKITCSGIALTDSIPLGDAIERLATAISRSGVKIDPATGNPTMKQVNKELGELLMEALRRPTRQIATHPTCLGFDPSRPLFMEGEAYSCPVNAEMVLLRGKSQPALVFPDTDGEHNAVSAK